MQPRQRVDAELVDFVGRHLRRRRGAHRPGVKGFAARPRPHAGVHGRGLALELQLLDLALERGRDLLGGDRFGPRLPIAGDLRLPRAADQAVDQPAAVAGRFEARFQLADGGVEQERGRHQPQGPRVADSAELAVELAGVGFSRAR